ncbi:MAG: hypothetical protein KDI46_05290 [Alphaproteobacteria bacterium]|nr:hypothetical protein [Alphaproteobacteria bacterium]
MSEIFDADTTDVSLVHKIALVSRVLEAEGLVLTAEMRRDLEANYLPKAPDTETAVRNYREIYDLDNLA